MKWVTLLLLMVGRLTWTGSVHADLYQDKDGVGRQKSYTEAPAWKPPIETSDQAYEEDMKAGTTEAQARFYRQYKELLDQEAEARKNASNQEYEQQRQASDAEFAQRRKENQIKSDEHDIEWDLKYDPHISPVGRQPVELTSRLLKKGYSEEAIKSIIDRP